MDIKKKNILLGVLIIGILSMTIAFATLSTRLNIGGTAEVTAQNWKIVINNWTRDTSVTSAVAGQTNTAEEVTPGLPANNTVSVSGLVVRFKQPGDRVKYTFNIANEGTIDAELQSWTLNNNLTCTSNNETVECPLLEKEIVCGNPLVVPEVGDELAANTSIPCTYSITYPEVNGSNEYEKSAVTISGLGANWTYVQKADSSIPSPVAQTNTLTLNSNGGSSVESIIATAGSHITLPKPSNENYVFQGWYTAASGGTRIITNVMPSEDTTYFAQWKEAICKRATSLHSEVCESNGGCSIDNDYEVGSNIEYGVLGEGDTLTSGQALDCKVSTNGGYTERFYYVSDYFDTSELDFDSTYATLLYYNFYPVGTDDSIDYNSIDYTTIYGPVTAVTLLPKRFEWNNITLKEYNRQILTTENNTSIIDNWTNENHELPMFDYSSYGARLLTYQELNNNYCNNNSGTNQECNYTFENSGYANDDYFRRSWYETIDDYHVDELSVCPSGTASIYSAYYVRPAIDVPKDRILLE